MTQLPAELTAAQLRRACAPAEMDFTTTAEVDKLEGIIGQERATRAIEFGIEIAAEGYNIFAMGPSGAGKSSTILHYLQQRAAALPTPHDWAYVRNPGDAYRPRALALPPGKGQGATQGLRDALRQVESAVKSAFAGNLYEEARAEIGQRLQQAQQQTLRQLEAFAHQRSFTLLRTPSGLSFAPMIDGRPLAVEEFNRLDPAQRQAFSEHEGALEQAMEQAVRALQEMQARAEEELTGLNRRVAEATVSPLFAALRDRFNDCPDFVAYMEEVAEDIVRRVVGNRLILEEEEGAPGANARFHLDGRRSRWSDDYEVNLIVDHGSDAGAPVIHEINPNYPNVIGKIEYRAEFGALVPDHHTIRAGALHRANGGYLVIDARALLSYPMAWEGLKRALRYKEIRIDDPATQAGAAPAASLAPAAIPLSVKVVLIGDPATYYTLYALDSAFSKLFKVRADFASDMEWSAANLDAIARFIRTRCEEETLRDFTPAAVAEVVEYAARLVESQRRLTTRFAHVADILREADYWAGEAAAAVVDRNHVQQAIRERRYRSSLYEEHLLRLIQEDVVAVATTGSAVGQVNGLSVVQLGDYAFGKPARISASVYLGNRGIINIEREADLSGRIHDKGVLILAGYLGRVYGQNKPLTLNASIAFEQSYDGVEGDSASSTELYALLSALADAPLFQNLAVTGSVNQMGDVQAVGGVTAKIEGFFDLCQARGLDGSHGVILPAANVQHLMLRQDVVQAVADGLFHIWPVRTVDEGFALLSGLPAGVRQADGAFPDGTFNRRVADRLHAMAETLAGFSRTPPSDVREEEDATPAAEPEPDPVPPDPAPPAAPEVDAA